MSYFREFTGETDTFARLNAAFIEGAESYDWGQDLRHRFAKEAIASGGGREAFANLEERVQEYKPRTVILGTAPDDRECFGERVDVDEVKGFDEALKCARMVGQMSQRHLKTLAERVGGDLRVYSGPFDERAGIRPSHVIGECFNGAFLFLEWHHGLLTIGWRALTDHLPVAAKEAA